MKFNEIIKDEYLLKSIEKQGFENLTPIQEQTIPLLRQGVDLIGKAKTGSGKTYAYAIPAMEMIDVTLKETQVLILSPTRELASQECDEIRKLNEFREGCNVLPIFGGAHMERQIMNLKRGIKVVIGTPGRLCDHLRRKILDLSYVKFVVLDEADEMLDMGFRDDIITILDKTPQDRQTALFSATMPEEIKKIAKNYMKDPVFVETDEGDDSDFIEQYYVRTDTKNKNMAIRNLLDTLSPTRCVIFCNTKKMVDTLYQSLQTNGYTVCELHGDIRQNERKATIKAFKNGEYPILIATDVAARGLDINGLDVVFNYDVPEKNEYYVHRIGRTGRAGRSGKAFTLINTPYQKRRFEEIMEQTGNEVSEFETKFTLKGEQSKTRKEKRDEYLDSARKKAQEKRKRLPDSKTLPYGVKNAKKGKKKEKPKSNNKQKDFGKRLNKEKNFIDNFVKNKKNKKWK